MSYTSTTDSESLYKKGRLEMKKIIVLIGFLFLFSPVMTVYSQVETAEEFERRGVAHFKRAFYEAIPKKDKAKADTEYALAEKAFQKAIQRKPDRVEPYLHLGRTYFVQKAFLKAATVYEKALRLAPERKEIYLQLASALEMAGDYKGAENTLKDLREQEKDDHSLRALDELINSLEKRIRATDMDHKGGEKQP
jgi:cytochrome c-type biogenesis protein CcmH/NrfG